MLAIVFDSIKGDCLKLLGEDITFILIVINEEKLSKTPKSIYKKEIRALLNKAAFKYFMKLNKKHSKLDKVTYTHLKL